MHPLFDIRIFHIILCNFVIFTYCMMACIFIFQMTSVFTEITLGLIDPAALFSATEKKTFKSTYI